MNMEDGNFLTTIAMQLVMHGGNARLLIREAIKLAAEKNYSAAREKLNAAGAELLEGHKAQTKVLQLECSGEPQGYNVLFCHGMDTLMTVKSEYEIAEMFMDILEAQNG